jgi:predicted HTH domain antitoxin
MNRINTAKFMPVTVTTRVEDELAHLIDSIAEREGMDRSTVLRRFLQKAAKDWLIDESVGEYERGKLTLWQAAERSGLTIWEMIEEVKKRSAHAPYTLDELKEDLKALP